jgi:hypothetical protein
MRHRTVSNRQKKLEINLSSRDRTVSRRPNHKITVSHKQKHVEQCLSDQAMNEECLTDKFPFNLVLIQQETEKLKQFDVYT